MMIPKIYVANKLVSRLLTYFNANSRKAVPAFELPNKAIKIPNKAGITIVHRTSGSLIVSSSSLIQLGKNETPYNNIAPTRVPSIKGSITFFCNNSVNNNDHNRQQ